MDYSTTAGSRTSAQSPVAASRVPGGEVVAGRGAGGSGRGWLLGAGPGWLLGVVLAVQGVLSVRLVWSDTAFQDEAAYLWAGHLVWAQWLHGVPVPPFAAYFSGAPVVYPPLGAVADSVGGLAGARVLSLVFMLGATALLWGAARRLFGLRAAFFGAVLFAVAGPTLHLGAFATYDAMSVFLVALAAWLVVRAGDRQDATGWMLAAAGALALANAAAYMSILFDLVVILLAWLTGFPRPGGKAAAGRCVILLTATAALLAAGLLLGGSSYAHGVAQTTLGRVGGGDPVQSVLSDAWSWTGVIAVAAWCGVLISWIRRPATAQRWLLTLLAVAVVLGPLEHARLHTTASLNKHGDLGAWFAAIAAGYAVDRLIAASAAGRARAVTCGACVVALAFPVALGAGQSRVFATDWPNSFSFTQILRPLADRGGGRLLVEDPSLAEYYLPAGSQWQRWSSTRNIVLPTGSSTGGPATTAGVTGPGNAGTFAAFIANHYFTFVALNFTDTTALDHQIAADLRQSHHYRIVAVVPYSSPDDTTGTYVIWQYSAAKVNPQSYEPRLGTPAGDVRGSRQ